MVVINGRKFKLKTLRGQGRNAGQSCLPNRKVAGDDLRTLIGQRRRSGTRCSTLSANASRGKAVPRRRGRPRARPRARPQPRPQPQPQPQPDILGDARKRAQARRAKAQQDAAKRAADRNKKERDRKRRQAAADAARNIPRGNVDIPFLRANRGLSLRQIKKNFRAKLKQVHPDRHPNDTRAQLRIWIHKTKMLNEAYIRLGGRL